MKINDWLSQATAKLEKAGIGTARLDCLVLVEDTTGKDRTYLLAHPEYSLELSQVKDLNQQIQKRSQHHPLAYLRGRTEFYGRPFIIDERVLEPRPESETIIEILTKLSDKLDDQILDVGTGSGALAITAKLHFPQIKVSAIDIDAKCLVVARKNAKMHNTEIAFFNGNLLEPFSNRRTKAPLILMCNLPYVPDKFTINSAAMWEPKTAIFGGADGLDLYRHLFDQIKTNKLNVKYILTESLPTQHDSLSKIANHYGFSLDLTDDFIQLFAAQKFN